MSSVRVRLLVGLLTIAAGVGKARAGGDEEWSVVRNDHFEVFSQAGPGLARHTIERLEQLRSFMRTMGFSIEGGERIRVIGFSSRQEYEPYRLNPVADAFYLGAAGKDYLVVPDLEPSEFGTVAHEYVHAVLHREGWKLPLWLGEGLAEYYSNTGDVAAGRYQTLQQSDWLDLADLLCWDTTSAGNERDVARMFYAESAALVQMLADSPRYRPQFAELLRRSRGGNPNLESITGLNLREIMADLHSWVGARQTSSPITLPAAPVMRIETSSLSKAEAALLLTELRNAGTESRMAVTQASADKKYMGAVAAFNDGDFEGAFASMRTLDSIREDQKFNYWMIAAFGLFASGDRQEATAAAEHARQYAAKPEEEAEASQLASMLASRADLRISHGTDGRNCISTSRQKEPE